MGTSTSSELLYNKISGQKFLIPALIASAIAITVANFLSQEAAQRISSLESVITPGAFVILSILVLTKKTVKKSERKLLIPFAIFAVLSFIGEQTWTIYETVYNIDPFPSIADFFWLSGYGFLFLFQIIQLRSQKSFVTKGIVIFSFITSIAFLVPSFLATYNINLESSELELTVALLYPVADTIVLGPALAILVLFFKGKGKTFWALILFGILSNVISDTIFLYLTTDDTYYTGHPIDIGWNFAYILFAFGIYNIINISKNERLKGNEVLESRVSNYMRFEDVNKIVIPIILATIIAVAILALINLYYFKETSVDGRTYTISLIYWIIGMMIAFSIIIIVINHNLMKMVKLRTKELQKERDGLEQLVKEKTQEMLKAEKLATVGELASRLGHDLRNPLTVIKAGVQITKMQMNDIDEKGKERFSKIEEAIVTMNNQIESMLNFIRSAKLSFDNHSLLKILESSLANIKKPDDIKINKPTDDFIIKCDFNRIQSIFMNLITNSIQAIGNKGEVTIRFLDIGRDVIIEVEDTGPGIANENIPRLFEPLFTTKENGTGLGLASCKNIVEQHGGTISVKNNPTTFTIRLPKKSN